MNVRVLMVCLASCLALAATADAQPGGGGGGGRGGRGGFGGGMMGRGGLGIIRLAGNEAVQKELALSTDQVEKVKGVVDAYRDAVGRPNFDNNQSEDERRAAREKMEAAAKTNTEIYLPKLKDILTSDQFTRLQQIHWQSQRSAAYLDPEMAKAISLSQDQQDKIKAINADVEAKRGELFASLRGENRGPEAFQQNREKFQAIDKDRDTKLNEVLTKDQQDKFASLKGKEFDLSQLFGGGPGGGGPFGGGGGGGGGGNAKQKRPQPKVE